MKKTVSLILFAVAVFVFLFTLYMTVSGTLDVVERIRELEATGGSGVDFLGIGLDILIMGIALLDAVGMILLILSAKLNKNRVIVTLSTVLYLALIPATVGCFLILYYGNLIV